jgi:fructose-6-phosphate aldolase 2
VKEKKPFIPVLKEIRTLLTDGQSLHAQVLAENADRMVEEAGYIHEQLNGNVFVKIPANMEGIKVIKVLYEKGIQTTATTVYTPLQALLAAQAGASYVAPYVNRVDNLMADGVSCLADILSE